MNRIIYKGNNKKIKKALLLVNQVFSNNDFFEQISNYESFDNTHFSPSEISNTLLNHSIPVTIKTWWNPFGRANAKTLNSKLFKMNTAKLKRPTKSIANTIIHEYVHAVDLANGVLDFTHFDNEAGPEEYHTAPWAIGRIAEGMIA